MGFEVVERRAGGPHGRMHHECALLHRLSEPREIALEDGSTAVHDGAEGLQAYAGTAPVT